MAAEPDPMRARASRFWARLGQIEGGLASVGAGLCLLAIMTITILGVFGRYVLGMDLIPGGYNIIERIAFPLLVFWAVPMGHREGSFPRFEILSHRLPPRARRGIEVGVLGVEVAVYLVVFGYLCGFAWEAIATNREMQIGTELWPAWPVIVMMPLAFALMLLEMLRLLWAAITRPDEEDDATAQDEADTARNA